MSGEKDKQSEIKFASIIAHQLKSPVTAAGTMIKTLLGEYAGTLTPKQKDLLIRIDKSLTEAVDTSKRMMSIANPKSLNSKSISAVDASLIVRKCNAVYEESAALKGITLDIEIKKEPIFVSADESSLTEIVNSLLSNALKYTPRNGIIRIFLSLDDEDKGKMNLKVADSGIGIPEDNLDKIFQPFFRSALQQGSDLPGAGLGLAFVKAVIDSLQGEIKAGKSALGGALFTVKLKTSKNYISEKNISTKRQRVVIIGGVAAGPKVASKIIRLFPEAAVTIVDKEDILSYSGCGLPYYISGIVAKKSELLSTAVKEVRDPIFFQNIKHVNILNRTEVIKVDRENKRVKIKNLLSYSESWLDYDKLVLATGSYPVIPEIKGIDLRHIFSLNGVHDAEGIKLFLSGKKARDVVIVGGGLIGLEITEALVARGCRVTIIEKQQHIFNILDSEISRLLKIHLESNGVRVLTAVEVEEFIGQKGAVVKAVTTDAEEIPVDMVVLATGVEPAVKLAEAAGLDIGMTGAIKVNQRMETSDSEIYAAGDCAECYDIVSGKPCYLPLGSTANKEGRAAAVNICGGNEIFYGINSTVACKIFDYFIAKTGLTEKEAIEKGYDIIYTLTAGPDREHFMPFVKTLMLKLIVERNSRKILGAQAIGDSKNFNQINIISTCMLGRMTIDEVASLDLCYAPAFSLAIDNVITAANVAKNKLNGVFDSISSSQLYQKIKNKEDFILLDVRSHREYEELRIPGATLIPLGVLRGRLFELPKDKEIISFCSISLRGYEAALILKANGFENVKVMDGGILMWPYDIIEGL